MELIYRPDLGTKPWNPKVEDRGSAWIDDKGILHQLFEGHVHKLRPTAKSDQKPTIIDVSDAVGGWLLTKRGAFGLSQFSEADWSAWRDQPAAAPPAPKPVPQQQPQRR